MKSDSREYDVTENKSKSGKRHRRLRRRRIRQRYRSPSIEEGEIISDTEKLSTNMELSAKRKQSRSRDRSGSGYSYFSSCSISFSTDDSSTKSSSHSNRSLRSRRRRSKSNVYSRNRARSLSPRCNRDRHSKRHKRSKESRHSRRRSSIDRSVFSDGESRNHRSKDDYPRRYDKKSFHRSNNVFFDAAGEYTYQQNTRNNIYSWLPQNSLANELIHTVRKNGAANHLLSDVSDNVSVSTISTVSFSSQRSSTPDKFERVIEYYDSVTESENERSGVQMSGSLSKNKKKTKKKKKKKKNKHKKKQDVEIIEISTDEMQLESNIGSSKMNGNCSFAKTRILSNKKLQLVRQPNIEINAADIEFESGTSDTVNNQNNSAQISVLKQLKLTRLSNINISPVDMDLETAETTNNQEPSAQPSTSKETTVPPSLQAIFDASKRVLNGTHEKSRNFKSHVVNDDLQLISKEVFNSLSQFKIDLNAVTDAQLQHFTMSYIKEMVDLEKEISQKPKSANQT